MPLTAQEEASLKILIGHSWERHGPSPGDGSLLRSGINNSAELESRIRNDLTGNNVQGIRNGDGSYTFVETNQRGKPGLVIHWDPNAAGNPGSAYPIETGAKALADKQYANRTTGEIDKLPAGDSKQRNVYAFENRIPPERANREIAASHNFGVLIQGGNLGRLKALDAETGATLRISIEQNGLIGENRSQLDTRKIREPVVFRGQAGAATLQGLALTATAAAATSIVMYSQGANAEEIRKRVIEQSIPESVRLASQGQYDRAAAEVAGGALATVTGAAVGGATAGLVSGPAAPVCSSVGAIVGAIAGGIMLHNSATQGFQTIIDGAQKFASAIATTIDKQGFDKMSSRELAAAIDHDPAFQHDVSLDGKQVRLSEALKDEKFLNNYIGSLNKIDASGKADTKTQMAMIIAYRAKIIEEGQPSVVAPQPQQVAMREAPALA